MKDRILAYLDDFANGRPNELAGELKAELKLDDNAFIERSTDVQRQILHRYSQFAISTIDAFFQKVIRSFTRESGLMGDYRLEVNHDAVLEEVINDLVDELGSNKELTEWVVEFTNDNLENEQAWDVRGSLREFAQQIFREEFKAIEDDILSDTNDHQFFKELKVKLHQVKASFINRVSKPAAEALQIIHDKGWAYSELWYGEKSGLFNFFKTFAEEKNLSGFNPPSDRIKEGFTKPEKWPSKNTNRADEIIRTAAEKLVPIIHQLLDAYEKHYTTALSAELVLKNMYVFGLIADISRKLKEYKERNNVMLLADASKFLNGVIAGSDTPFIYEKVGSFYKNYLIDEFQDTSGFQWKNFLPLLTNSLDQGNRSMVVGDVKQAIYRWRGGDLNLLQQQVEQQIGKSRVEVIELGTNYRSGASIIQFNNTVFRYASTLVRNITGGMLAEATFTDVAQNDFKKHTGFVSVQFIREEENATDNWKQTALQQIPKQLETLQATGVRLNDVAILVRKNSEGQQIAAHLLNYKNSPEAKPGCRYDVISNESLRLDGAATINLLLAALRYLQMPDDGIARAQLAYEYARIHTPERGLTDVFTVGDQKVFEHTLPDNFVKQKTALKRLPLFELTETLIDIFYLGEVAGELEYVQAFQGLVLEFYSRERNDVGAFLEWWEDNKDKKSLQVSGEVNAAQIVTMHKSKGLQFKYVLIPFCSWNMDHDSFNAPLLWVKTDQPPFADAGYVPVKYSAKLENTCFAPAYRDEFVRTYLDNLNLLYVAFTRAEHALFITAPHPKNKNQKGESASKLLYECVTQETTLATNWNEQTQQWQTGELTAVKSEKEKRVAPAALRVYPVSRWRDKLVIKHQVLAKNMSDAEQQKRIAHGIHIHAVLSRIHYADEIPETLKKILYEGLITEEEQQPLLEQLTDLLTDMRIADWFSKKWTVRTEVPIVVPGVGQDSRIDRLMINGNKAVVVDFKTGDHNKTDLQQVKDYVTILRQMNFTEVEGYVLYLNDREVVDALVAGTKPKKQHKDQLGLF